MSAQNTTKRHRRKGSDPTNSDPCQNGFIHQLGKMMEYLDHSCTTAVEKIHFPSDSTTVLGDMDTVDLEQMDMDTVTDTVGDTVMSDSDIRPAYSYATGATDDASTAFSASTGTSFITQSNWKQKMSKVPVKAHLVGRMHARAPETNTSSLLPVEKTGGGSFEDSSIVTAPTDSFTSSKATNENKNLVQNLQNTTIEEEEENDEVASAEERKIELETASNASAAADNMAPPQVTSQVAPPPPVVRRQVPKSPEDAAILQGLDLCRKIRQIQYQSSPSHQRSYERSQVPEEESSSLDDEPAPTNVRKTKMYSDRFKANNATTTTTTPQKQPTLYVAATVTPSPPVPTIPKHKSTTKIVSQKLKGIVPFRRTNKAEI